jgi:hypothetical protein
MKGIVMPLELEQENTAKILASLIINRVGAEEELMTFFEEVDEDDRHNIYNRAMEIIKDMHLTQEVSTIQ